MIQRQHGYRAIYYGCDNYVFREKNFNIQISITSQELELLIGSNGFNLCKIWNMMLCFSTNKKIESMLCNNKFLIHLLHEAQQFT